MLRLIVDDVDEFHPNDISYVYSGYAPLSIRLVQCAMQKLGQGGSIQSTGTSAASLFSYMGNSTANFIRDDKSKSVGGGWRGSEDILKLIPGQAFDIKQTVEYGAETNAAMARAKRHGLQHGKTTIIFFLGGCTHTEVSAVRFLAQHDEGQCILFILLSFILTCLLKKKAEIISLLRHRSSTVIHSWPPSFKHDKNKV